MKRRVMRKSLLTSAILLMMMVTVLVGASFAWFNVTVVNEGNIIQSGELKVEFLAADDVDFLINPQDLAVDTDPMFVFDEYAQPGDSVVKYLKITNDGNINLDYEVAFSATDTGLGEVIQVDVEGINPVVQEETFIGNAITSATFGGTNLAATDYEVYKITVSYDSTATGSYAGKTFELNVLLMAWQAKYADSKPVLVTTLAELQTAALNAVKGQQIVINANITDTDAVVAFDELVSINLGGSTVTLKEFSVTSTDVGVMNFNNGTLNLDVYTINTPNAELVHGADFVVDAITSNITTSGNSYILNGELSTQSLTLSGATKFKPQDLSRLVVTDTITASTGSIIATGKVELVINNTANEAIIDTTNLDVTTPVIQATTVSPGTGTLASAIENATSGDTILLANGIFNEAAISIAKDITIIGSSKTKTIIKPTANTGNSGDARGWFLVNTGSNLHLSHLTMDGFGYQIYQAIRSNGGGSLKDTVIKNVKYGANYGWGIAVMGQSMVIQNNEFIDIERIGIHVYGNSASGTSIVNNQFVGYGDADNVQYGIEVNGFAENVTISDNSFTLFGTSFTEWASAAVLIDDAYGSGIASATITNNLFNENEIGIALGYDDDVVLADISNNTFSNNKRHIDDHSGTEFNLQEMMIENTFVGDVVEYNFAIRSTQFVNASNINQKLGYATLTEALDAAVDGDTIVLAEGSFVFDSSISWTKSLTLIGAPEFKTIFEAGSLAAGSPFIQLTSNANLTVKNIYFKGLDAITTTGIRAGSTVLVDSLIVENSKFENIKYPIYLSERISGATMADNLINNLVIKDSIFVAVPSIGYSAYLGRGVVNEAVISGNLSIGGREGFEFYDLRTDLEIDGMSKATGSILIENNTFNNVFASIVLLTGGEVTIHNNHVISTLTSGTKIQFARINDYATEQEHVTITDTTVNGTYIILQNETLYPWASYGAPYDTIPQESIYYQMP